MSVLASIICIVLVGVVSPPLAFSQEATPAQQPDAKHSQSTESPDTGAGKAGNPSTAQQSDGQGQTDQDKKKTHRGSIVAAPLPMVSPALGAGIVPVLGYIFPLSTHDKVSPPSIIGGAGLITDNGSNGFGVGAQLFMKENRFQVQGIFAFPALALACATNLARSITSTFILTQPRGMAATPGPWGLAKRFEHLTTAPLWLCSMLANWGVVLQGKVVHDPTNRRLRNRWEQRYRCSCRP
jgi:hypothetical protein